MWFSTPLHGRGHLCSSGNFLYSAEMKYLIVLLMLVFSLSAHAQQSRAARQLNLKVNGLGLGTSHKAILKTLGKPISDIIGEINECNDSRTREMIYPGLKLTLYEETAGPGVFLLGEFEVTSRKWKVSGITIGARKSVLAGRFGKPLSDEPATGSAAENTWFYEIPDISGPGLINFDFRNGRLVRVYAGYTLC